MESAPPVIELDHLEVRLGRQVVLKELVGSLSGRAIGLLGPNGAGKTTLLHTLLGFHTPSQGTARVLGYDIRSSLDEIRGRIGYMPESDAFIARMSAVRMVTLMAELTGIPPAQALERSHEALFYVGLGEARYRPLGTYSLGMKQLVKLAQALVHGPQLLLLDEPTNGLDPPARRRMIQLVREIREGGQVRIILSSHLLRDVEDCCDEVLILKEGRIAVSCNLERQLKENRKFLEVETRGDEAAFISSLQTLGCEWARAGSRRLKMVLPDGVEVRQIFQAADRHQVQLRKLRFKRTSLEDLFLNAMEGADGYL